MNPNFRDYKILPKRLYTCVDYLLKLQYIEKIKPGQEVAYFYSTEMKHFSTSERELHLSRKCN